MTEYITKVYLDVDGQSISDFKTITEPEVEHYQQVNAMNKTGFAQVTPRYSPITVEYIIPASDSEFDWTSVKNGRLSIERLDGTRRTYTGVYLLKEGEIQAGEGVEAMTKSIELGATGREDE